MKICALVFILLAVTANCFSQMVKWSSLQPGQYKTGFKVIAIKDEQQQPFLISIWYPAEREGAPMTLKDYVETGFMNGSNDKQMLRSEFKNTLELPFLFGIKKLPDADYGKVLNTPVQATFNAGLLQNKWPLIISDTEPVSLCITNEWLAGNGYIVAVPSANSPPPADDKVLYKGPTDALEFTLMYMLKQSFIDTTNISALGFGGGAMASFFLAMRTNRIRSFVNIEGGIFQPESKTTLSGDYHPEKFATPLLHIVNPPIINGENKQEFAAIHNAPKFRVTILSPAIRHHDFTIYGRIVNAVLTQRGEDAELATTAFGEVNKMALQFFKYRTIDTSLAEPGMFKLEKF